MPRFTLNKSQRLKSEKTIGILFRSGNRQFKYPLKLHYTDYTPGNPIYVETEYKLQFAVSVPKKKFKKAHDRNRIKRLIREAYRLNMPLIINQARLSTQWALMFVYISDEELSFEKIQKTVIWHLQEFSKIVQYDPE